MKNCKHCGSDRLIKIGFKHGVQKWRCKECWKYQGAVDRREKYTEEDKKAALFLYLEGVGFRPAARILIIKTFATELLCNGKKNRKRT